MADAVTAALPNTHVLFTVESVCDWHPDKVCDRVAEAVVDELLCEDPQATASVQVVLKQDLLLLMGSVASPCQLPYEQIVRRTVKKLADSESKRLAVDVRRVVVNIEQVTPEAASKAAMDGVAGEAGIALGYATNETPEGMPLAHVFATRLSQRLFALAHTECLWVRAESQLQLTFEYKRVRGKLSLARLHSVLVTADSETPVEDVKTQLREEVVKAVVPEQFIDDRTAFIVSSVGKSGGVSGRRCSNYYSGWVDIGTSNYCGKDPSKIDRYGPLAARWVAKSLIKSGLCDRAQVQLAFSSALQFPLSISVDSFGTSKGGRDDKELAAVVARHFDLRPEHLVRELNLRRSIYEKLVTAGPFGSEEDEDCVWERPKVITNLS